MQLNGATRMYFIVGDPIAQVKSPQGVSEALQARGQNAYVMPAHVSPANLSAWFAGIGLAQNVDGVIVTVPHKFAALGLCDTASAAAQFVGAANIMRRETSGKWHGDMLDGQGFVAAMQAKGCDLRGQKALLVGAGGAGSAIAYSLVESGVAELSLVDPDDARANTLVQKLSALGKAKVSRASSNNAAGFGIVLNASPMGMKESDPFPIEPSSVDKDAFAGCVITAPAVSPWLQKVREARGGDVGSDAGKVAYSMTGADMFEEVKTRMLEFLLEVKA